MIEVFVDYGYTLKMWPWFWWFWWWRMWWRISSLLLRVWGVKWGKVFDEGVSVSCTTKSLGWNQGKRGRWAETRLVTRWRYKWKAMLTLRDGSDGWRTARLGSVSQYCWVKMAIRKNPEREKVWTVKRWKGCRANTKLTSWQVEADKEWEDDKKEREGENKRKKEKERKKKKTAEVWLKSGCRGNLEETIVRGSLPRMQTVSKISGARMQNAELRTTRVLTDTPSWRSGQWCAR